MTQRIKKITYKRPNVSLGNSTDAILPGGPLLPDFYLRTDILLVEAPPPPTIAASYIEWEWNGEDLSQFDVGGMISLSGAAATPGLGDFGIDVVPMSEIVESSQRGTTVNSFPLSDLAYSGSAIELRVSGAYNAFFIPISGINPQNYRELAGAALEMVVVSGSGQGYCAAGFCAGEIINDKFYGISISRYYVGGSMLPTIVNNNTCLNGTGFMSLLSSTPTTPGPEFFYMEHSKIHSGTENSLMFFDGRVSVTNFRSNQFNQGVQSGCSVARSAAAFATSSFSPNMFGVLFYTNINDSRSINRLYISRMRLLRPLVSRIFTPEAPQVIATPIINTGSSTPQVFSNVSLSQDGDFSNMFLMRKPFGPYSIERRWLRAGSPIANATSSTYRVTDADVGSEISYQIVASNSGGNAVATSVNSFVAQSFTYNPLTGSSATFVGNTEDITTVLSGSETVVFTLNNQLSNGTASFSQATMNLRPLTQSVDGRTFIRMWKGISNQTSRLDAGSGLTGYIPRDNYHVFVVFRLESGSLNSSTFYLNHRIMGDSNLWGVYHRKDATEQHWVDAYQFNASSQQIHLQHRVNLDETYILDFSFSGSAFSSSINSGSYIASSSTQRFNSTPSIFLGDTNYPFFGSIGEVLFFNSKLADSEVGLVKAYLSNSWGATIL